MAITVDYDRLVGYPQENISWDGITVVDGLRCLWTDRVLFAKQILGYVEGLSVIPPHVYDFVDGSISGLYAQSLAITPIVGLDQTTGEYKYAQVVVNYSNIEREEQPPAGTTTYVTENIEPTAEYVTYEKTKLYWLPSQTSDDEDSKVLDHEVPVGITRRVDWVYTIHRMETVHQDIFDKVGYVNSSVITSGAYAKPFAAETLLYGSPSLSRELTSEGATAWTATMRFSYKPEGWNKFAYLRNATATEIEYKPIYIEGASSAKKVYKSASFSNILQGL